jgi:hypothetical protein
MKQDSEGCAMFIRSTTTKLACIALGVAFAPAIANATQFIPQVQYSHDDIVKVA